MKGICLEEFLKAVLLIAEVVIGDGKEFGDVAAETLIPANAAVASHCAP
jgi:hypothetical protein